MAPNAHSKSMRAGDMTQPHLGATKRTRSRIKFQRPAVLWFTGLSGAGKSTIADLVERKLNSLGAHTTLLDGDNLREGLNRDLGFGRAARRENVRRTAEVAKLMTDAGLITICALISPFLEERDLARKLFEPGEFIEVFVDTPLEECIERDPKGLYRRALANEIEDFTGIHQPYEPPEKAELILRTLDHSPDELADQVIKTIRHFLHVELEPEPVPFLVTSLPGQVRPSSA